MRAGKYLRHLVPLLVLVACASEQSGYGDVWRNYDVRDVNKPREDDPRYRHGYYEDNDSYYTAPSSYGCSPADIGSIGCE